MAPGTNAWHRPNSEIPLLDRARRLDLLASTSTRARCLATGSFPVQGSFSPNSNRNHFFWLPDHRAFTEWVVPGTELLGNNTSLGGLTIGFVTRGAWPRPYTTAWPLPNRSDTGQIRRSHFWIARSVWTWWLMFARGAWIWWLMLNARCLVPIPCQNTAWAASNSKRLIGNSKSAPIEAQAFTSATFRGGVGIAITRCDPFFRIERKNPQVLPTLSSIKSCRHIRSLGGCPTSQDDRSRTANAVKRIRGTDRWRES